MPNLTVAVLGEPGFAKELGKTGTSSDITLYNLKRGTDSVTFIEPTRYPEKVAPLFFAASMADRAILVVNGVDAAFGETVLMLQCAGVAKGHLVLRNYLTRGQLLPLIRGTVVEGYEVFAGNPSGLRDSLLDEAAAREKGATVQPAPGGATVPIDHFFPVRGIGTVVLGTVASGEVHPHDTMQVLPLKRQVQVRSIQKLDDDADNAVKGDRVGLALKGIEAGELDRGYVLTNDPGVKGSDRISGTLELVPYWKIPLKEGMAVHAGHWMQFVPGWIESVEGPNGDRRQQVTIRLDREIVHPPNARVILHHLEGGSLRVIGVLRLP
ncbi:MAG TPA: EF-Tu/IF-2/RF-3 family GTPase [Methanomicrobiales archaeon]|nr:EF-Tu/IF-2/RF-3 family GTPase [Methanomicrobiales archaeon]